MGDAVVSRTLGQTDTTTWLAGDQIGEREKKNKKQNTHRAPIAPLSAASKGTMSAAMSFADGLADPCVGGFTPTLWRLFSAIDDLSAGTVVHDQSNAAAQARSAVCGAVIESRAAKSQDIGSTHQVLPSIRGTDSNVRDA